MLQVKALLLVFNTTATIASNPTLNRESRLVRHTTTVLPLTVLALLEYRSTTLN